MKLTITCILLFFSVALLAQAMPNDGFNKARIVFADRTVQAELNPVETKPEKKADRIYFWYSANVINSTQGGFSGQLLNGSYNEYYLNKNLKTQGAFFNGLKDGLWSDWMENGVLINRYTWKRGLKDGKYTLYNEKGVPVETGIYSNNLLNGPVYYLAGKDSLKTVYYKNGLVIKKRSFIQRINIFKKKQ